MAVTAGSNLSGTDGQLTPTDISFYSTSNNRRIDAQYDQAGNMTVDLNFKSFSYDAENRQTLLNPCTTCAKTFYTYDGEGHRIIKQTEGQNPVYFVYNAQGQLLAEYGGATPNGGTRYLTGDHLGSTRGINRVTHLKGLSSGNTNPLAKPRIFFEQQLMCGAPPASGAADRACGWK